MKYHSPYRRSAFASVYFSPITQIAPVKPREYQASSINSNDGLKKTASKYYIFFSHRKFWCFWITLPWNRSESVFTIY